jgi:hypothetical protein
MSDIGLDSVVETLPISEWQFSVRHICLRYQNNRCQCRMSDIADIKIDVDAYLWLFMYIIVSDVLIIVNISWSHL